jgi:hypothetical protein
MFFLYYLYSKDFNIFLKEFNLNTSLINILILKGISFLILNTFN